MRHRFAWLSGIAVTALLFAAAPAEAAPPDASDYGDSGFGMDISAYGLINFGWHTSLGAGAQFAYPIVPAGFVRNPRFRDALHIEGGLDFGYFFWSYGGHDYHMAMMNPVGGVRWAIYVLERLAPFACAKLGAAFPVSHDDYGRYHTELYALGTVGVIWDLSDKISLRAEVGYQYVGGHTDVWRIGVLFRI